MLKRINKSKPLTHREAYIGIDNGVTGAIGIIAKSHYKLLAIPTRKELSYTKQVKRISRINFPVLCQVFEEYKHLNVFVAMERPMINPGRFSATLSALRALEATLICLEVLDIPHIYCDSKEWQKMLLPKGLDKVKDKDILKTASKNIGERLFPRIVMPSRVKDYDAILIAEWARRKKY